MSLTQTKTHHPSLVIGAIIGAILTCVVLAWIHYWSDEEPEYVDIGYMPQYPIYVYLSESDDPSQIRVIVLDPSSVRFGGLYDWLGGINATPATSEEAPASFSFEAWKKKPTTQTAILVQHDTESGNQLITMFEGWYVYREVKPGKVEEGYISKWSRRTPFFELMMLVPPDESHLQVVTETEQSQP